MSDDRARQDRAAYFRGEPLTDESARREVGWIAREARAVVDDLRRGIPDDPARMVELFGRKARLLDYIDEPELAAAARQGVDEWRAKRAPLVPDPLTGAPLPTAPPTEAQAAAEQRALDVPVGAVEQVTHAQLLAELLGGRATCDECSQRVSAGTECPECLAESLSIVHDRCCDEGA